MPVPFLDLKAHHQPIEEEIFSAIRKVIDNTAFAGGPFVAEFEKDFATFCQTKFAIGLGSGTEALWLPLLACGIGAGDEVITSPSTFLATAEAISFTGATPVFVDINEDTYTLDPELVERAITPRTKAIIPVHLFGQMADMGPLLEIARRHKLRVIEDACQAHGAEYKGRPAGSLGDAGAFSFYPGKNLGAFGEAGGVTTNDAAIAKTCQRLRDHGQEKKYYHSDIGWNARMDGIQGAVLTVKLKRLERANRARREHAKLYNELLSGLESVILPLEAAYGKHVYHIYAVRVKNRDHVLQAMGSRGIACGIHYPIPVHLQQAYQSLGLGRGSFPVAEQCADEFLSLPMFPELTKEQIETVARELRSSCHPPKRLMPASFESVAVAVEAMPAANASPSAGTVRRVNPLLEAGWDASLAGCESASFFHTSAWARVLQTTYRYTPLYYALRDGDRLLAALPVMEVDSWLTGRRGVSLPFTDDCEPLSVDEGAFRAVYQAALDDARDRNWKYLELRGGKQHFADAPAATTYYGHEIKLAGTVEALFAKVDSSVRRAVRKAEENSVRIEIAQDFNAMRTFYRLQCQTRQRHGVPPQTFGFFKNIQEHVLAPNKGFIVTARHQDRPVAAAVFFQFGKTAIYKYGASDERFQQIRANNLVMWEAIQWHARHGFERLSLGRTALENSGLRRFKRSWGSEEHRIEYLKYDRRPGAFVTSKDESTGWQNRVLQRTPVGLARMIGAVLYKHMA